MDIVERLDFALDASDVVATLGRLRVRAGVLRFQLGRPSPTRPQ